MRSDARCLKSVESALGKARYVARVAAFCDFGIQAPPPHRRAFVGRFRRARLESEGGGSLIPKLARHTPGNDVIKI